MPGLVVPFVGIMLISPQLHFMTYGFYQHEFTQVVRMGGYRPMVFLQHGIAVFEDSGFVVELPA